MSDTANLNAELFRQLSYIADDETYMKKALNFIKKLAMQKEAEAEATENASHLLSKKEALASFDQACKELKENLEGKLTFKSLEEALNEL